LTAAGLRWSTKRCNPGIGGNVRSEAAQELRVGSYRRPRERVLLRATIQLVQCYLVLSM